MLRANYFAIRMQNIVDIPTRDSARFCPVVVTAPFKVEKDSLPTNPCSLKHKPTQQSSAQPKVLAFAPEKKNSFKVTL
jgi:hypothetical protein